MLEILNGRNRTDLYNIVFLLTHVPNPRINKRISVAKRCGNVVVICTRRKSQNIWEPVHTDIEHIIFDIDLPSSKHLLKRYLAYPKYQEDAYKYLLDIKPDLIYAESLDSLIIANKYRASNTNTRIFFEVADLRECFIEKPKSLFSKIITRIISRVEKWNFTGVNCLVVTSMKFFDLHYKEFIEQKKVIFLPNIPDPAAFTNYNKKIGGQFTVGFIGGIRYLSQMKMLVDAAERVGCKVLFAGEGVSADDYKQITEYCKGKESVSFTGKYNYNEDIAKLYSMVDCVYAVYDANNANVRIALPNKLYEAMHCELPIIVAKGTYLEEIVAELNVGIGISCNNVNELADVIQKLSNDSAYYKSFVESCVQQKGYTRNDSYGQLLYNAIVNIY